VSPKLSAALLLFLGSSVAAAPPAKLWRLQADSTAIVIGWERSDDLSLQRYEIWFRDEGRQWTLLWSI
jgi:hypothetical protein